jgi:signal transduction histidine kinase
MQLPPQPTTIWRRIPALAATAAGILLGVGLAVIVYSEHVFHEARLNELTVQSRILAATVTAAMTFNDRDATAEYVDALKADPALRAAAVYTPDGRLFAGYVRGDALPLPVRLMPGENPEEDGRLIVTTSVTQNGTVLGTVYVRSLTEPLPLRIQRYSAIVLLAVMASLVVVVLAVAQAALTRVNTELAKRAAELAEVNEALQQQIIERERAEESLRQAQKMEAIGQLTGGIAHDFNNLLQVILGNLDMMRNRIAPEDQWLGQKLLAVQRASERAAVLTSQLLAFARRQPLAPRSTDVNKLVSGMSNLLHRTLGEAIGVETVQAAGLWRVSADTNQLENALINLAVNARDAMPGGGKLTIETQNVYLDEDYAAANDGLESGQYVMVAVSDTGTGMPKDIIAKAFEPFFTTKEIGRGTGLGLSQVYGFVKQSGGHVKIYSEPGEGTTVKIYLPRLRDSGPAEIPPPAQAIPHAAARELILLVEDDEDVRAGGVDMLIELGYRVIEAADGAAALRLLEAEPNVRLLFTDVGLPGGLNGRQLADEARRRRPDLPILFTTGYTRNAIIHHGRLDAGIELIGKPFTYAALAAKIRRILEGGKPDQA